MTVREEEEKERKEKKKEKKKKEKKEKRREEREEREEEEKDGLTISISYLLPVQECEFVYEYVQNIADCVCICTPTFPKTCYLLSFLAPSTRSQSF